MAGYVVVRVPSSGKIDGASVVVTIEPAREIEWHAIGGSYTDAALTDAEVEQVIMVQADGDELALIERYTAELPLCTATRVTKWYGDHAKFIAGNFLVEHH